MDAFFASVELRDDPALRGKPVAVAYHGPRSVVTTATYEARAYGVHSALPLRTALRRCPHLIVIEPRMDVYREASRVVRDVFHAYALLVEPVSIDEAFLDLTEPLRGPPSATLIARELKREIRERTGGLTASVGVSYCKFLSKIASGMRKPDGLTVIRPEEADGVLAGLDIRDFYGIGPKTAERMHELGVLNGADLKQLTLSELQRHFGERSGGHYWRIARGIDDRPVDPGEDRKSVGAEETFDTDLRDLARMRLALRAVAERTATRLDRHVLAGRTVTLKVKFADFQLVTRRVTLPACVSQPDELHAVASRLLTAELLAGRAVRLLGVTVSSLEARGGRWIQPPLFDHV